MTFKNNRTKYLNKKTALFTLIAVSLAVLLPVATSFAQTVSFSPATNFAVGSRPHSVVIGDLNGDGKPDLAVSNDGDESVSILLNTGTGAFGSATRVHVNPCPESVAIGDLNGDGKLDLAVAIACGSNAVSILLGDGTGAFGSATYFAVGSEPTSVAIGDLNGDGKPDLAVANAFSHTVSILLGTGTGSFEAATDFAVGSNPYSVAIGDLNGDGKPDLATANVGSNTVSILLGTGTGSFGAATDFAVGSNPHSVAIGDLNGDGKPDLATTNVGSTNVSILLNTTQSLSGDTRAWGNNLVGQLGNGTFGISNTPTSVSNLSQVSAISGGAAHSLAVKADGSAWAWGDNDRGQLGNGTSIISNVPVAVSGLTQLSAVAAGGAHSLAVKKDGTVWAWGDNHLGQLGLGTLGGDQLTPVQITSLAGVKAVTAGLGHSVALKTDGTVYTWGDNHTGQLGRGTLGRGTSGGASATPGQVIGLSNVTAIASFGAHTLALKADGTVWAWGDNHLGQLGHGTAGGNSPLPVQVTGLSNITKIVTGLAHSLARSTDGTVHAWGANTYGQLGDGTVFTIRSTPILVQGLTGVIELGAGGIHSLALKSDGTAWAWGNNFTGQLGTGSFTSSPVPVQVNGLTGGLFIAGGGAHSLAVVTSSSP